MSAPQRVNVLLSRARNALIMIGNAETYMNSRKGKEVWVPLMNLLKENNHVYNGFPVKCEQHPDKKALLTNKHHFDSVCPDGGCSEPWYAFRTLGLVLILTPPVVKRSIATSTLVPIAAISYKITVRWTAKLSYHRNVPRTTRSQENATTKPRLYAENVRRRRRLRRNGDKVITSWTKNDKQSNTLMLPG
jgi:hypothetical protein